MKTFYKLLIFIVVTPLLASCAHDVYHQTDGDIAQSQAQMNRLQAQNNHPAPPVVIKPGYYVNTTPVSLQKQAAWLSRPVSLRAKNVPFNVMVQRLLRHSNVVVSYDNTVQNHRLVSLNYSGTIKGALQSIADETDYAYQIDGKQLLWSAFETKTFNISFMPGQANYMLGRTEQQDQNSQNNNNSESNGVNTVQASSLNDVQYSNLQAALSVWADIRATLNDLKSKQGRVIVSESTTSVTVHDRPDNVRAMAKYLKQLNHALSQEVAIKVEVLEIELNKDYNYGINWNAITHVFNTKLTLQGDLASATNLVASSIARGGSTSTGVQIGNSTDNLLITALSQQGKLRVVTKPEVVTLNNQVASIRITQDTGYIQSVNQSFNGTNDFVTTSITPGNVEDGFTLYVLPKIQGNHVYMQISSTIANLLSLNKISTEPSSTSSSSTQQYNAIEVPTLAQKSFNQRSVVPNGSTLIIAGYKRLRDEIDNAKLFGTDIIGGKGAKGSNIETLVLITPTIIRNNA